MFYGTEKGNRLVDENNYPDSIKVFLKEENKILISSILKHDVIIEVGCMEARNMEHAINNGKKYIGIDIVDQYIKIANEIVQKRKLENTCEFICLDAEKLDDILKESRLLKASKSPLFFFPFNSFGNMENYLKVLESISRIKNADFILFSYNTDERATNERFEYYNNCNYENLSINKEKNGVRFISANGLNSMAYNKNFLQEVINQTKVDLEIKEFAEIGIAYFISTREKVIEK